MVRCIKFSAMDNNLKIMKYLVLYSILLFSFQLSYAENSTIEDGNNLFKEGKYQEAIDSYESILNSGLESGALYYNLGNAYFKNNNIPKAILNYERAKLLLPHDKDIKYNLALCNSQITDKLKTVDTFFLITWFENLKNKTKSDTWAFISIISFLITIVSTGFFLFSKSRSLKQIFFGLGIVLLLFSMLTFDFSANQKSLLTNRDHAIIFNPSVAIKSSPSDSGKELFILHEGTKVKVIETVAGWNRIQISDGNEGWAPAQTMEVI